MRAEISINQFIWLHLIFSVELTFFIFNFYLYFSLTTWALPFPTTTNTIDLFLPSGRFNLLTFPRSKSCQELLKCSFQINKPKWQQHSSHTLGALPCFVSLKEKKTHNSVLRLLSHFSCLTCQVQVSQVLLLISF